MQKDLRTYLKYIKETYPEELLETTKEVDPCWEIAAVIRRFQENRQFPAVLFKNTKQGIPVISNILASRNRLGAIFETEAGKAVEEYCKREEDLRQVEIVADGPVKEVITKGSEVDLTKLPICFHGEKDSGPYLTPGLMILRDPETGVLNMGIYRNELKAPNKLGVSIGPNSHAAHIIRKYERMNKDIPCVIALGHHPAVVVASQSRVPSYVSELEVAGGLLGEALKVVKCETSDLVVPAWAEIAIEGIIPANHRENDGPFGEFTWYYGPARPNPVINVTAITRRHDAIFHDLYSPYIEHNLTGYLGLTSVVYRRLKQAIPCVKAVDLPESGCCRFVAYVQLAKEFDGQGKNAALVALGADPFIKAVVVVDEDIDIYSERDVWWAVWTRTNADKNFFFVPDAHVCRLIPSGHSPRSLVELEGMDTKVGIDATLPILREKPFSEKCDVKKADWMRIQLGEYNF